MTGLKDWLVRHDRSGRVAVVKGKSRATVERRYPTKDYTVLSAAPKAKAKRGRS